MPLKEYEKYIAATSKKEIMSLMKKTQTWKEEYKSLNKSDIQNKAKEVFKTKIWNTKTKLPVSDQTPTEAAPTEQQEIEPDLDETQAEQQEEEQAKQLRQRQLKKIEEMKKETELKILKEYFNKSKKSE